jgi:hypothetical protein
MVHVPAVKPVTVLPLTVQIDGVALPKLTVKPDVAVALAVVTPFITNVVGEKVIDPMLCPNTPAPMPLKLTLCGLPAALLVMVITPFRVPGAVGVKVTVKLQKAPAPSPLPQLFVTAKSPLTVMLAKLSAAAPMLVNAIVFAALLVPSVCAAKLSEAGLSETTGAAKPVPLKLIVSGLLAALLLITMLPLRAPTAVGVKVTLIVQFAPCARVAPQVVVLAKSPLATMLAILSDAPPGLARVIVWAALVEP